MKIKKTEDSVNQEVVTTPLSATHNKKNMSTSRKIKSVFFTLLVLGGLAGLGYLFFTKTEYGATLKLAWQIQKDQQLTLEDTKALEQLKKIMLLPEDVIPTMARITDIEALKKEQPEFFADAENGDRVVIYSDLVIVFSAEKGKIIKVGPVKSVESAPTETASQEKN